MRTGAVLFLLYMLSVGSHLNDAAAQDAPAKALGSLSKIGDRAPVESSRDTAGGNSSISGGLNDKGAGLENDPAGEASSDDSLSDNDDVPNDLEGRIDLPSSVNQSANVVVALNAAQNRAESTSHTPVGLKQSSAGALSGTVQREPQKVEVEEEKLRNATIGLVLWLRNRLRKRLADAAKLEAGLETETILLRTLNESITNKTEERSNEIRLKQETQKKLSAFRRKAEEPEQQLHAVQNQAKKLSDQLALLGETYNSLAGKHRKLREKLRLAGFSHWLDARGKEYLPATAVGVLAKSTELFSPLAEGLEQAVEIDKKFARKVEDLVPRFPERSLLGEVFEDLVMLGPILPVLVLMYNLVGGIHRLSVLHLAMHLATAFMMEAVLLLLASACLGRESLRALQQAHNDVLVAGVLVNATLYLGYMVTQLVITVLRLSKVELAQSLLGAAIGWQYFFALLRPAVMDTPVKSTVLSHLMVAVNFGLVLYEKNEVLNVHSAWAGHLNTFLVSVEYWTWETIEAMGSMFNDYGPDMDLYRDRVYSDACGSSCAGSDHSWHQAVKSTRHGVRASRASAKRNDEAREQVVLPKSSPPLPSRPRYGRWAGARIIDSARHYRHYQSQQATPMIVRQSESEASASYASCRE